MTNRRELFRRGTKDDLLYTLRADFHRILEELHVSFSWEEIVPHLEAHDVGGQLLREWDRLDSRERRRAWKQLLILLREIVYARRPYCVRCGDCCRKGSPTLHEEDLPRIMDGSLRIEDLYTLRKGEIGYSTTEDEIIRLSEERIKIREKEGSRECLFYNGQSRACSIYDRRPLQCRVLECWNPEGYARGLKGRVIGRKDILSGDGVWRIIEEHENRCPYPALDRRMRKRQGLTEEDVNQILEMLRYDFYLRSLMAERIPESTARLEFLFGRPLIETIEIYGLRVEREGEKGFRLVPHRSPEEKGDP